MENQATFSPIIHEDNDIVVRGAWKVRNGKREYHICVHNKRDGVEYTPLAYWLGSSFLMWRNLNV